MRPSVLVFAVVWAGLAGLGARFGFDAAYDVGYAAIALLAAIISATFAWLWRIRATPMALGMALSWAGCAGLVGFWWTFNQAGRPPAQGIEHQILWACVSLHLAGSAAHLRVLANAHGGGRVLFAATLAGVIAASLALAALVG